MSLSTGTFNWKHAPDAKRQSGIIAQEVVETLKDYEITSLEDFGGINYTDETYSAAYTEFIPILMKAIQELSAEVKELKEKI